MSKEKEPKKSFKDLSGKKKVGYALQTIGAVIVTLIMVFPLYWMLVTSLKSTPEVTSIIPTFWPKEIQWSNYMEAWTAANFPRYIWNTVYVTVIHMVLQLTMAILAAYGFARGNFPCKGALFLVVLSAMMIPNQLVFAPIYVMIANLDLVDTLTGIILPGIISAQQVFLLRQNFMSVDQSYLDAGRVDGLGILGTIWHILIPMCKASVITVALTSFIGGWNNYFWPKILSKSDDTRLISVAVNMLKGMFNDIGGTGYYNTVMAGVMISIVPIVLVFAFNQKYMLKGYSKAAMK